MFKIFLQKFNTKEIIEVSMRTSFKINKKQRILNFNKPNFLSPKRWISYDPFRFSIISILWTLKIAWLLILEKNLISIYYKYKLITLTKWEKKTAETNGLTEPKNEYNNLTSNHFHLSEKQIFFSTTHYTIFLLCVHLQKFI